MREGGTEREREIRDGGRDLLSGLNLARTVEKPTLVKWANG